MTAAAPASLDARFTAILAGVWHIANPDRGQRLEGDGARMQIGGSYVFAADSGLTIHRIFRDDTGKVSEQRLSCSWRFLAGRKVLVELPGADRELFAFRSDGALKRLLALHRVWEPELVLHKTRAG